MCAIGLYSCLHLLVFMGGRGGSGHLSVWWIRCYRSTKDLCCPIQQGIQARISSPWKGLWCICASGCLISANRKGWNGCPQLFADFSIVEASLSGQALCAAFGCRLQPECHVDLGQNVTTTYWPHLFMWTICLFYRYVILCSVKYLILNIYLFNGSSILCICWGLFCMSRFIASLSGTTGSGSVCLP